MTRGAFLALALTVAACRSPTLTTDDDVARAAAVAALPSAGCRAGVAAPALHGERRSIEIEGVARSYLIDAPAVAGDAALPLVLAFHGFRHNAAGLRAFIGFAELAAAGRLIAVHPDGREGVALLNTTGRGWDLGPDDRRDVVFVRALLDRIEQERCVDRRRIFATGFSNGGFLANLLGCQLADRLAAVAPVSGARALDRCAPTAPMPILLSHGTSDRLVPPRLSAAAVAWWRAANHCEASDELRDGCVVAGGCQADVVLCEGPQAHTWPPDATARIWRFFQAHPRE